MKLKLKSIRTFFLFLILTGNCINLFSQNIVKINSIIGLQSAINSASPGDTLLLADGTYLNSSLTIGKSGITVKAETPGGVFLNGTQYINITGNNITFSGFQFTDGNVGESNVIDVDGDYNTLTQLNFKGYSAKKYIVIKGGTKYNEISYCNIENKPVSAVIGCTIQISTSFNTAGYHKISYCSFKNFPGPGGDYGNEPIRIGLGAERDNISRTIVEYCYFENVGPGDGESISVKCCENVCRYNTFTNNPDGMLVFRNGDRNVAYGNFFINGSGGIRIKEARDSYCYNNYFETGLADPVTLQYETATPLNNAIFVYNTFVNSEKIDLGKPGPTNVTFANNIFKKASGNIFKNATGNETWIENIYYGSLGISASSGLINKDPLLEKNADGFYGLSELSPAIDAATEDYPSILDIANVDDDPFILQNISGQSRTKTNGLKDIGCDEFTTGVVINRPLNLSEVGPSYLGGPSVILKHQTIEFVALPPMFVNDPDFNPGAIASSGLPAIYESSDTTVTIIVDGLIRLKTAGTTFITASQNGNDKYKPASEVSQKLVVNWITHAPNLNFESDNFFIYPNPATNYIKLSGEINCTGDNYAIISMDGKTIIKGRIQQKEHQINISKLPSGKYILNIERKKISQVFEKL